MQHQQSENRHQNTERRRDIQGHIQSGGKANRPEGMEEVQQVVADVALGLRLFEALRGDAEH